MSITNLNSLDMSLIKISIPKKVNGNFHSKLKYNQEKIVLKIESCKLVEIKTKNQTYLHFKLNNKSLKSFSLLEEHIVDILENKNHLWNNLDIGESFQKNIKTTGNFGTILFIKMKECGYSDFLNKTVDLYIRPNIIKCSDQKITIVWQISDLRINDENMFIEDDKDSVDVDVLGPYEDEIKLMKERLISKLEEVDICIQNLKKRIENQDDDIETDVTNIHAFISTNLYK